MTPKTGVTPGEVRHGSEMPGVICQLHTLVFSPLSAFNHLYSHTVGGEPLIAASNDFSQWTPEKPCRAYFWTDTQGSQSHPWNITGQILLLQPWGGWGMGRGKVFTRDGWGWPRKSSPFPGQLLGKWRQTLLPNSGLLPQAQLLPLEPHTFFNDTGCVSCSLQDHPWCLC